MRAKEGNSFELKPFLGHPMQVEFVDQLESHELRGSSLVMRCTTLRHRPEIADYYGTDVELVFEEPVPGRHATVVADFWTPSVIRFRYAPGDTVPDSPLGQGLGPDGALSPMVTGRPDTTVHLVLRTGEAQLVVRSEALELTVVRDPFQLVVRDTTGRILWATRAHDIDGLRRPASQWRPAQQRWTVRHRYAYPLGSTVDELDRKAFVSFDLRHDERIVGYGQTFGPVDHRGTSQQLWIQEAIGNSSPASYIRAPFHVSSRGHGIFVHTSNAVTAHVGSIDHTALSIVVDDAPALDWFVIAGQPDHVLARYAAISGGPVLPPRWTFGFWMSRITYTSRQEVEHVADELRRRHIPADVIHLDTGWFEHAWLCDLRFSPTRFPDPAGMADELRERGFRLSVWQWPNYTVDNPLFVEASAGGFLAKRPGGYTFTFPGGWGEDAGLIDVSNADAIAWYKEKLRGVLDLGISAIKVDFGEGAPTSARYARVESSSMHNLYPVLYQQAVWDVTTAVRGANDTVIWARSGWAGSQRYPVHWSGDGVSRFEDLACVLRSMLSMAMSGFLFYSHDVGGFWGNPSPELYVRWMQLGVFSSHVRSHGLPPREPWEYGEQAEDHIRNLLELRYRLLPYIWTAARVGVESSLPVTRPLCLGWPDDPVAWRVDDQFLFGPDILVAPILEEGSTSREVYLPAGRWWDFWSGDDLEGARFVTVQGPLDRIPLFVRDGALIPMGPVVQHVDEQATDPLELHLWGAGSAGQQSISVARGGRVDVSWSFDGQEPQVVIDGAPGEVVSVIHDRTGIRRVVSGSRDHRSHGGLA